jgi:hypothetical protein
VGAPEAAAGAPSAPATARCDAQRLPSEPEVAAAMAVLSAHAVPPPMMAAMYGVACTALIFKFPCDAR